MRPRRFPCVRTVIHETDVGFPPRCPIVPPSFVAFCTCLGTDKTTVPSNKKNTTKATLEEQQQKSNNETKTNKQQTQQRQPDDQPPKQPRTLN